MGYPLKAKTIEAISLAQEPTNLPPEGEVYNQIKVATNLIKRGGDYDCQRMVDRGWRMLVKIWMNNWKELDDELTPEESELLAQTREDYLEKIEEIARNNEAGNVSELS